MNNRKCGLLLALSALPGGHGIGDMGPGAYAFLDYCEATGIRLWQILPIHPLGYGNSPYQPFSSYAGEALYISLDKLKDMGLLENCPSIPASSKVAYDEVRKLKEPFLKLAYQTFQIHFEKYKTAYEQFCERADWLVDYALFMALKEVHHQQPWAQWDPVSKEYEAAFAARKMHEEVIQYHCFLQFIFFTQWHELRAYANKHQVSILGDMPIYVGIDSVDVWRHREYFLLAPDGTPNWIAGVPPDYFSEDGQRWGNPLYDWDYLKKHQYGFWIQRLRWAHQLFDAIRIDHFRAFDSYWQIPSTCKTAVDGTWMEGPKEDLFNEIYHQLPDIQIVAEDLGDLRPSVLALRDHYELCGMNVLQFILEDEGQLDNVIHCTQTLMYTGTHDNPTLCEWLATLADETLQRLRTLFMLDTADIDTLATEIMTLAVLSEAVITVLPVPDLLHLRSEGRMNTPSTIGSPNWEWRLCEMDVLWAIKAPLQQLIQLGRR